ncbi:di-heme oxidoredictase family protein [Ectopseudomonas khazarica]|uniref:Di-heme oxidoredictase family protein n=1 Tax=Ectopseudomonas khazarica TaxID=2502979 RepID=A0ABW7MML3_9GAMM
MAVRWATKGFIGVVVILLCACQDQDRQADVEPGESMAGGSTTTKVSGSNAFSMPGSNLTPMQRMDFSVGNAFFRNAWVAAGQSPANRSGVGPLLNTDSCQSCHIKDGRGHPPREGVLEPALSSLVRLSIPAREADAAIVQRAGSVAEPTYGGQLQDNAIAGHVAEGHVWLRYETHSVQLADGTQVELRKPVIEIRELGYGALHPETLTSLRVAPPMIGLGLLEAIDEADLRDNVKLQSKGGVSGRLNLVWDAAQNQTVVGRFGWKAGQPNLDQQNAGAFAGDMGLTSTLHPQDDCTARQPSCMSAPQGGQPEVSDAIMASVLFYTRNLAVPARRDHDKPEVLRGKAVFQDVGCAACHRPSYVTGAVEQAGLSGQTIYPYTDLLLHDMGDGLADGRPEFLADGREWRTPPLWGIGLTQAVNGHTQFLHDGRARNLLEAILWHGGEAQPVRDRVVALDADSRQALLRFLESL